MGLKEIFKKYFKDDKKNIEQRYVSSKFVFITSSLFFCFNFYFVGAGFFLDIFGKSLIYMYFLFIFSFFFYIFFFLKNYFKNINKILFIIIMIFVFLILLLLSFIFIIDGGIYHIIDLI